MTRRRRLHVLPSAASGYLQLTLALPLTHAERRSRAYLVALPTPVIEESPEPTPIAAAAARRSAA